MASSPTSTMFGTVLKTADIPIVDLRARSRWRALLDNLPLLCAIHCALTPFVILALPLLGAFGSTKWAKVFTHSGGFELAMILFSAMLAGVQLWRARSSTRLWVLWASGLILGCIGLNTHALWWHAGLMVAGAACLIAANRLSVRAHRCSANCSH
jgi:MerC mercury resistance protein